MNRVFAAALALSLSPSAFAGELEGLRVPEADFTALVGRSILPMQAKNAFDGLAECGLLDNKRLYELDEAVSALQPCLDAVSRRYGAALKAEAGPVGPEGRPGIVIYAEGAALTAPVMRDLNLGLAARGRFLLGHGAVLRRGSDRPVLESAPALEGLLGRLLAAPRGFAAKWDQCQDDETCGSEHYCCVKSTGNRCVKNNVVCK